MLTYCHSCSDFSFYSVFSPPLMTHAQMQRILNPNPDFGSLPQNNLTYLSDFSHSAATQQQGQKGVGTDFLTNSPSDVCATRVLCFHHSVFVYPHTHCFIAATLCNLTEDRCCEVTDEGDSLRRVRR